jgi:threonylcarbamoyladenosine tRNA methylthiotransferase CDKAL1
MHLTKALKNIKFLFFVRNEVEAGRKRGKAVVVAGCVPQGAPKTDFLRGLSVVGVQQIDRVVEVVEETLKGMKYIS